MVLNKPPCKVQTITISPFPRISPPSNKAPRQFSKLTISPIDNKPPEAKSRIYGMTVVMQQPDQLEIWS